MVDFPNTPVNGDTTTGPNNTEWMYDGIKWTAAGVPAIGNPPTGPAGGDLGGTYPNPTVLHAAAYMPLAGGTATGPIILSDGGTAISQTGGDARYLRLSGGTLTGALTLPANATANLQATTLQQMTAADALKLNLTGGTLTGPLTLSGNATTSLQAVPLQQLTSVTAGFLALSGGTLTGPLILNADPTAPLGAATRQYVDNKIAAGGVYIDAPSDGTTYGRLNGAWVNVLPLAGGTLTGGLTLAANATANLQATTLQQMNAADALKLNLTGGTLTGPLTLSGNAAANLQAIPLQQMNTALALKLNLAGGTLTGPLILQADPGAPLGAATKQYVDGKFVAGGYLPLTGGTLTGNLTIPVGTAAAPSLNFTGNTTTGLYAASGLLGISVAGGSVMTVGSAVAISANVNVTGSVTSTGYVYAAVNFTLSNSGASISSDTNATYFFQDGGQWRWQYNRANGGMQYIRGSDNASLFSCDPNGNCATAGNFNAAGTITSTANGRIIASGTNQPCLSISDATQGYDMGWWLNAASNPALIFGQTDGNGSPYAEWGYVLESGCGFTDGTVTIAVASGVNAVMWANSSSFYVPNGAFKPGGGVWADSSDARIKTVLGDYTSGLDAILRLRPVRYRFRGNLRHENAPTIRSGVVGQHNAAVGAEFIGLVAQEAETVMPEMVTRRAGFIDDEPVDDLRMLDMTALPLALVNAVKALHTRIAELEARWPTSPG